MPTFAADTEFSEEQIESRLDVAFGVAVTTQYVSRGVAQSDGLAVQGYIEPSYGIFYAGVWASNTSLAITGGNVEIDVYAGIRPTFGDLSLDFGYVHYFYDTGSCCGELYGKASYAFTDWFTGGVELYRDLWLATTYGEVNTEFTLPHDFTISGALGTNFAGSVNWNAGIGYTFADTVSLDLRYHDANVQPARFVATLSLDSALSAIMKN